MPSARAGRQQHHWNLAEIGTIPLPDTGPQLLTFHYGKGNKFAYFEFERVEPRKGEDRVYPRRFPLMN